jgi:hypothetical protein
MLVIYHLTFLICRWLPALKHNLKPEEAQLQIPTDTNSSVNGQMRNGK